MAARQRAFTLVELMVTIAVMVVLVMAAAPSFTEFRRNSDLVSGTNTLLAAINTAKSEAMKRSANAGVAPITGTDWSTGLRVFVDQDMNGTFNGDDIELTQFASVADGSTTTFPGQLTISTSTAGLAYIGFTAAGYLQRGAAGTGTGSTLSITRVDAGATGKDISTTTRRIIVALSGQVRSCKPASTSDATCKKSDGS